LERKQLVKIIRQRGSFLCVGLDPDMDKMPAHLLKEADPIFEFNKAIIDATRDYCVAYKPNTAFYECHGVKGWEALEKTVAYIGSDHFIIADAKRGDIGNTSKKYAETFFKSMSFDAITVAPYMGSDSVLPFTEFQGKWVVLLALTSNPGAIDFQLTEGLEGNALYKRVLHTSMAWGTPSNFMYVVGATRPDMLAEVRKIVPDHFLLVPGVGAQGGSLEEVCHFGMNDEIGLLVNASRSILYASNGKDFATAASAEAKRLAKQMKTQLKEKGVI
jgi:orotidine-5'-phosphate decarboxylase